MSEETRAAFDAELGKSILTGVADRAKLTLLAQAHVDDSPPLPELLETFDAATTAMYDGTGSVEDQAEATYHMVPVRQATAILAGAFPDMAPVIVADETGSPAAGGGEGA